MLTQSRVLAHLPCTYTQPFACISRRTWRSAFSHAYFVFIVLVFAYDYTYDALSCLQSDHCTSLISKFVVPPVIHFSSFLCGAYYFRLNNGMDTSRGLIEAVFLQSTKRYTLFASHIDARRLFVQHIFTGIVRY